MGNGAVRAGTLACLVAVALGPALCARAEEPPSRARELEARRRAKLESLAPPAPGRAERFAIWLRETRQLERLTTPGAGWAGFRPRVGTILPNGGLGAGFFYDRVARDDPGRALGVQWGHSLSGYRQLRGRLAAPVLPRGLLSLRALGELRHRPRDSYHGLGPDSPGGARSVYGSREAEGVLEGSIRARRWLRVDLGAGLLDVDLERGTGRDRSRVEDRFDEAEAPGVTDPRSFSLGRLGLEIDYRDRPGRARAGGLYRLTWSAYDDGSRDRYDFRRLSADLRQYLPFHHGHRVIALRALASYADPAPGSEVPFYLMDTLGGSELLRGFPAFRFRDRGLVALSAEYRWQAGLLVDMALFVDAGKVVHETGDLDLRGLETSYGIGIRLGSPAGAGFRLDLARSRETTRLVMSGGAAF